MTYVTANLLLLVLLPEHR